MEAVKRRNKRPALNRLSTLIARRENAEGPPAGCYYANIVYGTALVGLLIEASEEREAWSEAVAICSDLSIDSTVLNLVKVVLQ